MAEQTKSAPPRERLSAAIAALKSRLQNGVAPAMATPLESGGHLVDAAAVGPLVELLLAAGASGLFVGGTTGEGIMLDRYQRQALHETALAAAAGRVPVILHVGANRTADALALASHAAAIGADAVAAVTPHFYGVSDAGLSDYYLAIAGQVPELPLFLYDIPHLATNEISPALAASLSRQIPSLAGMKSSRKDANIVRQQVEALPDDRILLAGNETIALAMLALGADGLVSGLSTAVPEPFVGLVRAFAAGDIDEARRQQRAINEILALMPAGARIGAIKRILQERGLPVGRAADTLPMPSGSYWPAISRILAAYG